MKTAKAKAMHRVVKTEPLFTPRPQGSREEMLCKFTLRPCLQNCLEGFSFCLRHILEDKAAPFRQCAYVTKVGRRCPSAAPKQENKKDGFCSFHTKRALVTRQRLARKRRQKETPDSLLEDLVVSAASVDPNHVDHRRAKLHSDNLAARVLDYASSSDSESESLLVEQARRDSGDSDAESIDSDQEDMLKYAGVYTTEEVAQILRDKLIRLQALYIDQFKRLKHVLLTKRAKFLQAQAVEQELYGSVSKYKHDPHHKERYEKLFAMKRYHKKFGVEALLQRQSTLRRMKVTEGMSHKLPVPIQCSFVDEGVRCNHPVVPLSKLCQKHILHDQSQVLYRPCPFADSQCGRPVATLMGSSYCSLHLSPLTLKQEANQQEEQKISDDKEPAEMKPPTHQPETKPDTSTMAVAETSLPDVPSNSGDCPALPTTQSEVRKDVLDTGGGHSAGLENVGDEPTKTRISFTKDEDDEDVCGLR